MKFKQLRANATLRADGKPLVFKDGVLEIKKVSKTIQFLIDNKYIEEIKDGEATNK